MYVVFVISKDFEFGLLMNYLSLFLVVFFGIFLGKYLFFVVFNLVIFEG